MFLYKNYGFWRNINPLIEYTSVLIYNVVDLMANFKNLIRIFYYYKGDYAILILYLPFDEKFQ